MKIKHGMEKEYQLCKDHNQDFYGFTILMYAESFADLLEKDIESFGDAQKAITEMAKERSHEADTYGITGNQYGCAISVLSQVWEYGEILRKWHNKEYGYEGDGCVNPAVLVIEKK